ncbi:MAG: heparinase II/III family protein [Clostridia bacterium]|nr:heparinase II/III family protein [Clostridia bacterium]
MKSKLTRIISLLLILASLVSCLTVFSFAETAPEEEENTSKLIYYRGYEEGWEYNNGVYGDRKDNHFFIDYEEAKDFSYNYFLRIEDLSGKDGFMEFRYGSDQPRSDGAVMSFDIKVDDKADFGGVDSSIIYLRTVGGSTDGRTSGLVCISGGKLYLPNANGAHSSCYNLMNTMPSDEWIRLTYVFDLGSEENDINANYRLCKKCFHKYDLSACNKSKCQQKLPNNTSQTCEEVLDPATMYSGISCRIYVGYASTFNTETATSINSKAINSTVDLSTTKYYDTAFHYNTGKTKGIDIVRFGLPSKSTQEDKDYIYGQSYCIDNLAMYNGESGMKVLPIEDILSIGTEDKPYGTKINSSAAKVIEILSGSGEKSNIQYVNEALLLKVGVEYGLYAKQRKAILTDSITELPYGAPIKSDGKVYVPFQAVLDYIGYPSFKHDDNMSYDFATDKGSALLTVGRDTATVNGSLVALSAAPMMVADADTGKEYVVIALDDVETLFEGYYVTYDDMGLIIISEKDELLNRDHDLETMLTYMCMFIYDYVSGDEYYNRTKNNTKNFTHPYLLANQEKFDYLHRVYTGEEQDELLKGYLEGYVNTILARDSSTSSRARSASTVETATGTVTKNGYDVFRYGWEHWLADDKTVDSTGAGTYLDGVTEWVTEYNEDGTVKREYYKNGAVLNPHDLETNAKKISGYTFEKKYHNYGYDYDGGRLNESGNYNNFIKDLAFCYQVTRKEAFARLAYEAALAMAKWEHWGPGHFLNTADATTPYAMAYDWLYNVWCEFGYDLAPIEKAIWDNGIHDGILVSYLHESEKFTTSRRQGTACYYTTMKNNWNAVCTSGMVTGALAILGVDYLVANDTKRASGTTLDTATIVKECKLILENNTKTLANNGLGMYAPDGSYIESPNYWKYSTSSLFQMIWALMSATGDDSGFLNMWAMDKTFYFAVQCEFPSFIKTDTNGTQSSGYQFWNYHDSQQDPMDSGMFFYAAEVLGQEALAAIRLQQLERKGIGVYDFLAYKPEYAEMNREEAFAQLDLTYVFESCDGIVSRDYFGDGCLYTGIMGNMNNASHAQIDSGNFIYANNNFIWFCDLGSENYNVYGYFSKDEYRYAYYRMTAEGNNVIALTSDEQTVPWGQVLNGGGELIEYDYNEFGMKAIIDNVTAYGDLATSCLRGMLFTNNRKTVVVQDEIIFDGTHQFAWLAQTTADIEISEDGRTAYLIKEIPNTFGGAEKTEQVIRCSIVSPDTRFTFSEKPATTNILNATIKPGVSVEAGGVDEKDRSKYNRLCIDARGLKFNCAVVIEEVENKYITAEDKPVEYEWNIMRAWEISESFNATTKDENAITKAQLFDVKEYGDKADAYVKEGTAFGNRLQDFYLAMQRAAAAVVTFMEQMFTNEPALKDSYYAYKANAAKYNAFQKSVNASIKDTMSIGVTLGGYQG